jgi:hypothetical protein
MEKNLYKEIKLKEDHILQIFQDTWGESPREWSNLGTMAIFHRRYNFGDEVDFKSDDFNNWSEMGEYINKDLDAAVCIPIYMYDHSGITINCDGFACPWDSGQVGYIYVSKQKLKDEYGVKRISSVMLERAEKALRREVHVMDQYITGDVYGFQVIKRYLNTDGEIQEDIIDSCSGFYGDNFKENGMMEYIDKDLLIDKL